MKLTRWQCEFSRGPSRMRWVVMAFGEESAKAKAEQRVAALGKGWHLDQVKQIKEEAA